MIQPLTTDEITAGLAGGGLQRFVNEIFAAGPDRLAVATHYAKSNCSTCGGNGFLTFLKRAGAAESEPRVARLCGCARKNLLKEAQRRQERRALAQADSLVPHQRAAEGAPAASGEPSAKGEV